MKSVLVGLKIGKLTSGYGGSVDFPSSAIGASAVLRRCPSFSRERKEKVFEKSCPFLERHAEEEVIYIFLTCNKKKLFEKRESRDK